MKTEALTITYDRPIIKDFWLNINENGIYVISGASGKGKTSFFNAVAQLISYSGKIDTQGKVSYMFQEDRLLPWLSAIENAALPLNKNHDRAEYYIKLFGLWEYKDVKPSKLSGGMKRRVALARCLAYDGDVLLLDEPFTGLDKDNIEIIVNELNKLKEKRQIYIATHELPKGLDAQLLEIPFCS